MSFCITFDELGFERDAVGHDAVEGAGVVLHHPSRITVGDSAPLAGGDR